MKTAHLIRNRKHHIPFTWIREIRVNVDDGVFSILKFLAFKGRPYICHWHRSNIDQIETDLFNLDFLRYLHLVQIPVFGDNVQIVGIQQNGPHFQLYIAFNCFANILSTKTNPLANTHQKFKTKVKLHQQYPFRLHYSGQPRQTPKDVRKTL